MGFLLVSSIFCFHFLTIGVNSGILRKGMMMGTDAETGICSWYGGVDGYNSNSVTANGEGFDLNGMTAAHKTLPFGTRIRVTNPRNRKSIDVRINDRGPFVSSRILDLTSSAFQKIEDRAKGLIFGCVYKVIK